MIGSALIAAAVLAAPPSRPMLMIHVMPWFEAGPDRMGWHWTMNKVDPAEVRRTGRVASHFRPLIGAYDSDDPVVVELQTLWMRVAGFDGVLADWYGTQPHYDYPMIHVRTLRLFDAAERAGLRIAVVYEDQTVRNAIRGGLIGPEQAAPIARDTGRFLRSWFVRPGWWRIDGQPVVMVFGPQHFGDSEWAAFREGAGDHRLFVLHHPRPYAQGVYDWPLPSQGLAFNRDFPRRDGGGGGVRIPVAFPRFRDWYEEGGQTGYPDLPDADGATYRETLAQALAQRPAAVQVATWNDWQEGTQIEPSVEYGLRDLRTTQAARRKLDPDFPFAEADLDLPLRLYRARRAGRDAKALDAAADALRAGRPAEARRHLDAAASMDPPKVSP